MHTLDCACIYRWVAACRLPGIGPARADGRKPQPENLLPADNAESVSAEVGC